MKSMRLPLSGSTLAACALVLIASGDDFNLVRLVLPGPVRSLDGQLPLDDKNTDFVDRGGAQELNSADCTMSAAHCLALNLPVSASPCDSTRRFVLSWTQDQFRSLCSFTPLRC
jgi:hypothetical protein